MITGKSGKTLGKGLCQERHYYATFFFVTLFLILAVSIDRGKVRHPSKKKQLLGAYHPPCMHTLEINKLVAVRMSALHFYAGPAEGPWTPLCTQHSCVLLS